MSTFALVLGCFTFPVHLQGVGAAIVQSFDDSDCKIAHLPQTMNIGNPKCSDEGMDNGNIENTLRGQAAKMSHIIMRRVNLKQAIHNTLVLPGGILPLFDDEVPDWLTNMRAVPKFNNFAKCSDDHMNENTIAANDLKLRHTAARKKHEDTKLQSQAQAISPMSLLAMFLVSLRYNALLKLFCRRVRTASCIKTCRAVANDSFSRLLSSGLLTQNVISAFSPSETRMWLEGGWNCGRFLATRKRMASMSMLQPCSFQLGDGRAIPAIGLGTFKVPDADVEHATLTALKLGYRHIDTAEGYRNQAGVGRAIQMALSKGILPSRNDVFITTKVWPGSEIWKQPLKSKSDIFEACRKSLQLLQVEYVDLYLIHVPLSGKGVRLKQWRALVELKQQGLARSIGVSNYGRRHLEEIVEANLELPAANQLELHPLCQHRALLSFMQELGVNPIAYSSLAPLSNWRLDYAKPVGSRPHKDDDENDPLLGAAEIAGVAKRLNVSAAKLLLTYGLQKSWPILPKTTEDMRLAENLNLGDFIIPAEDMELLDGLPQSHPLAYGRPGKPFDPTKYDDP